MAALQPTAWQWQQVGWLSSRLASSGACASLPALYLPPSPLPAPTSGSSTNLRPWMRERLVYSHSNLLEKVTSK